MKKIRILHTCNLFLDGTQPADDGCSGDNYTGSFVTVFDRLATVAIKNEVQLFVVVGNLFSDATPDQELVNRVVDTLNRLSERGIVPVLLAETVGGCPINSVVRKGDLKGTIVIDEDHGSVPYTVEFESGTVHLYGIPFRFQDADSAFSHVERTEQDGWHVGLLQGKLSVQNVRGSSRLHISENQLKSLDMDYLVLGLDGGFTLLEDETGIYGCSPGSPEGRDWDETGDRYCSFVELGAPNGGVHVSRQKINEKIIATTELDVTPFTEPDALVEAVCSLGHPDLLLKLTLLGTPQFPICEDRLFDRCSDQFSYLKIVDTSNLFASDWFEELLSMESVLGGVAKRAKQLVDQRGVDTLTGSSAVKEILCRVGRAS